MKKMRFLLLQIHKEENPISQNTHSLKIKNYVLTTYTQLITKYV